MAKANQNQWLVLGSFKLENRQNGMMLQGGCDLESAFTHAAGETFDRRTWTPYTGDLVNFLDPRLPFEDRQWCYAYAMSYVQSPRAMRAQLLVGSDDGVLAYLNGQEVLRNDCQRAYTAHIDEIPVSLKAGWNTLVFRVTQAEFAWSVKGVAQQIAHLAREAGRPANGRFQQSLAASPQVVETLLVAGEDKTVIRRPAVMDHRSGVLGPDDWLGHLVAASDRDVIGTTGLGADNGVDFLATSKGASQAASRTEMSMIGRRGSPW